MPRYARYSLALAILLVGAFAFLQYSHHWYRELHDPEKINFWVAFGTLALAVTTVLSVLETQQVLSREDVRHQESYAPIVTVVLHWTFHSVDGFYVRNGGLGPAMNVQLSYEAMLDVYERATDERGNITGEKMTGIAPYNNVVSLDDVISAPGSRTIDLTEEGGVSILADRIHFRSATVTYFDVFGNKYSTIYKELTSGKFGWVRPKIKAR